MAQCSLSLAYRRWLACAARHCPHHHSPAHVSRRSPGVRRAQPLRVAPMLMAASRLFAGSLCSAPRRSARRRYAAREIGVGHLFASLSAARVCSRPFGRLRVTSPLLGRSLQVFAPGAVPWLLPVPSRRARRFALGPPPQPLRGAAVGPQSPSAHSLLGGSVGFRRSLPAPMCGARFIAFWVRGPFPCPVQPAVPRPSRTLPLPSRAQSRAALPPAPPRFLPQLWLGQAPLCRFAGGLPSFTF